jgi:hypothetical protein
MRQHGLGLVGWLIAIVLVGGLLLAGYVWLMLHWSYSSGERAGWVQKLSKKGFLCKTWEGEMAMVSLPGSVPEKFVFTAWDDQIAERVSQAMGKRVSLRYEDHIWLPSSCFGDTQHFVKDIRVIDESPAPLIVPGNASPAPVALPPTQPPAK